MLTCVPACQLCWGQMWLTTKCRKKSLFLPRFPGSSDPPLPSSPPDPTFSRGSFSSVISLLNSCQSQASDRGSTEKRLHSSLPSGNGMCKNTHSQSSNPGGSSYKLLCSKSICTTIFITSITAAATTVVVLLLTAAVIIYL